MAEEFSNFLAETRKAPLEEKLNAFGDIIEKIMQIILKIPDLVDRSIQNINSKVSSLQTQVNAINSSLGGVKGAGAAISPTVTSTATSPSPGGPPPPPAGPPGGPPGGGRPASPMSLRGAIMGELKELFARRKSRSE